MKLSHFVNNSESVVTQLLLRANSLGLEANEFEIVLTVTGSYGEELEFDGRLLLDPERIVNAAIVDERFISETKGENSRHSLPFWNGKELWFKDRVVKRFRRLAQNQQTVLAVFQEEGWPERIDNPIPANDICDAQSRLHDTIKSLNRNHIPDPSPLRFRGDGTGTGVVWEKAIG